VPGAPLDDTTELRVVADVAVQSAYPFYHLLVGPSGGAGVSAFVGAHLLVTGSAGDQRDVAETLLSEHRLGEIDYVPVPARQRVRFDVTLILQPGTVWVYVGLAARVEVQRWWLTGLALPPLESRTGFVGVDLLAPDHGLPVEPPLQPAGPITLRSVNLVFCRQERFAEY
jgi:hypothetical protein